jgi:hypothetical protein
MSQRWLCVCSSGALIIQLRYCYPGLPSTFHGGPPSPTCRTSDAKDASVLFSPAVDVLYGYADPTRVSWAAEKRKAEAEGEAEPMNGDLRIFGCR